MSPRHPLDFVAFFDAVHGVPPFPWQRRLAAEVVSTSRWPPLLDLPTGSGKTAVIDIAVFHLAHQASGANPRSAPMRILFVIDRRIVVDDAFERARRIARALRTNRTPAVAAVAAALVRLSGDAGRPLDVVRLRGGVPRERDWARSPSQPLVVVSTVDQVGSRLLFRGYGVSDRMKPVHAGLVGSDALWLLDEVHLSQPLLQTMDAISQAHSDPSVAREARLAPFGFVQLSATPGEAVPGAFRLDPQDRDDPVLGPRLRASKRARIEVVKDDQAHAIARRAADVARGSALGGELPACRIGVVANHVALARDVFGRLRNELEDVADVTLLIGPVRAIDRIRVLDALRPFQTDPARTVLARPHVLVATQTVEAGADFDFDALLTQIAPIDALRQRLGRVDRLGRRGRSDAVIFIPSSQQGWKSIEHLYGDPARRTADWLRDLGDAVDLGIEASEGLAPPQQLTAARPDAPVLMPAYIGLWNSTAPAPAATPEPELFLHGPGASADVQIIWREDVDTRDLAWANTSLRACPPSSLESVSVPVWAARAWLRGEVGSDVADVPEVSPSNRLGRDLGSGRPFLRMKRAGPDTETSRRPPEDGWEVGWPLPQDLRPADLIVVPTGYGGCDTFGWHPGSAQPVTDIGVEAHYRQRLRGTIRVTPETVASAVDGDSDARALWHKIVDALPDDTDPAPADVAAALTSMDAIPELWRTLLGAFGDRLDLEWRSPGDPSRGFVLSSRVALAPGLLDDAGDLGEGAGAGTESITGESGSWRASRRVSLADHSRAVGSQARTFAERLALPPDLIRIIEVAGLLHDIGKADPRFQSDLGALSELARVDPEMAAALDDRAEPLAKSDARAGLSATPRGFRHEALSVALARNVAEVAALRGNDRDLLLWLIGTHHGHGRPLFPPLDDPAPEMRTSVRVADGTEEVSAVAKDAPVRLGQGWPDLAERVVARFGPWELARLESIIRLADHVVSAGEAAPEV